MAFQFTLATVLRVRGVVEEREERMLQRILQEISCTLQAMEDTNHQIAKSNASRVTNLFKASAGTSVHALYGEIEQLKLNRKELEVQLEKLEQLKESQLKIYSAARRDREMLSDMCEEKREVYESDVARREQSTLDDNFIARRGRV